MTDSKLMGNCVRCYYAVRKKEDGSCVCARYPKWVDVYDMDNHFCAEHVTVERIRDDR